METIIENGKKMEGIPYPVAVRLAFHIPTLSEKVKKHTPKTHTQNTKNGSGTTR